MASATDNTAGVAVPAKKYAYVTMITSDSFMPGLQCMVYSLQKTGTKIPICVLVTCQVSKITQLQIKSLGVKLVVVKPIGNPNTNSHAPGWVNSGYTKLHIWNLTEFDKVVYVDADTIVLQGIDEVIGLGISICCIYCSSLLFLKWRLRLFSFLNDQHRLLPRTLSRPISLMRV